MFDNFNLKLKMIKVMWKSLYGSKTKRMTKIQNLKKLLDKYEKNLEKNK